MKTNYQLFEGVRLLKDHPTEGIKAGQVGAIVEIYRNDGYEVEFCDERGQTIAMFGVHASEIEPENPVSSQESISLNSPEIATAYAKAA